MFYLKKYIYPLITITISLTLFQAVPAFAQSSMTSCAITKVGNPAGKPIFPPECPPVTGGDTEMSRTALALAAAAQPCNNGIISNITVATCMINNIGTSISYPEAAAATIIYALNHTPNPYQCIAFVESVVAGAYGDYWNTWPNAIKMVGVNPYVKSNSSIKWTYIIKGFTPPLEGDVPIWNIGSYGHIGVFTKIDPLQNIVAVTDANYDLHGGVKTRNTVVSSTMMGWEHK